MDEHPSEEELVAYVTRTADLITHAIVEQHLLECAECAGDARQLQAEDAEITRALEGSAESAHWPASRLAVLTMLLLALLAALAVTLWWTGILPTHPG